MSMSNATETSLLNLLFKNLAFANVGDAAGLPPSVASGSYFISLHTADPGEAGNQSTNEVSYGSYARVAVARGVGFTVSGAQAINAAQVQFPTATSGSGAATHFAIGLASSGAGQILLSGALNITLNYQTGTTPIFPIGELVSTAD
jgi:hypothetical protein